MAKHARWFPAESAREHLNNVLQVFQANIQTVEPIPLTVDDMIDMRERLVIVKERIDELHTLVQSESYNRKQEVLDFILGRI